MPPVVDGVRREEVKMCRRERKGHPFLMLAMVGKRGETECVRRREVRYREPLVSPSL